MNVSTEDPNSAQVREIAIDLFCFYRYGYEGRAMYAVRAPFTMPQTGEGLVGRLGRIQGKLYRIVSILRQIDGPITTGDAVGVEVSAGDARTQGLPD